MKLFLVLFILTCSCHGANKITTNLFQPNDLIGSWQVNNKEHPGTMEFKNDSILIMEYQGYKAYNSYRIDTSKTPNILEIHPKDQDSLHIAFMKIEKINQNEINIEFVTVTELNQLNNTYNIDTSHTGSVISLKRKNN